MSLSLTIEKDILFPMVSPSYKYIRNARLASSEPYLMDNTYC